MPPIAHNGVGSHLEEAIWSTDVSALPNMQAIDYTIGKKKKINLLDSPINTVSFDGGVTSAALLCSAGGEPSLPEVM